MGRPPRGHEVARLFGFNSKSDFKTITIRDNLIEVEGPPRPLLRNAESYGATIANNMLKGLYDTDRYANPRGEKPVGLETPLKFECGVNGERKVDGWVVK